MRMRYFLVALSLLLLTCLGPTGTAQSQQVSQDARKVVHKTAPVYPEIAKRMSLSGTAKIMAIVAPDGTVKSVQSVGGSPVLIQAAQDAVQKWKFAPASSESKEIIEIHFGPQ
jgi:TonB family protein